MLPSTLHHASIRIQCETRVYITYNPYDVIKFDAAGRLNLNRIPVHVRVRITCDHNDVVYIILRRFCVYVYTNGRGWCILHIYIFTSSTRLDKWMKIDLTEKQVEFGVLFYYFYFFLEKLMRARFVRVYVKWRDVNNM